MMELHSYLRPLSDDELDRLDEVMLFLRGTEARENWQVIKPLRIGGLI